MFYELIGFKLYPLGGGEEGVTRYQSAFAKLDGGSHSLILDER